MKIIICGAGQVGTDIAKYLAEEENAVTLIDSDEEVVDNISESIDVRAVYGHGSYPEILEEAGAENADMIIAVTPSDELNMVTSLVANSIFHIPTKIARIRSPEYLGREWADIYTSGNMPIDVIISPEIEMAKAIERNLSAPGALEVIPLLNEQVYLLSVRCDENCPVLRISLRQIASIFPDIAMSVTGIVRNGHLLFPSLEEHIQLNDEVYFLVKSSQVLRALNAFGHEERAANHIVIFGAGRIGVYLAGQLEEKKLVDSVTIIERDAHTAEKASEALPDVKIIHGDFLEADILEEAGIRNIETSIALSGEDEDNILGSLLVRRYGVKQTFAMVDKVAYNNLVANLGVDVVLDPKSITISSIIHHIRRGNIQSAYAIRGGIAEVLEVDISANAEYIGMPVEEMVLPKGAVWGGIFRDDNLLLPYGDTVLASGDILLFFVRHGAIKNVEKMFSAGFNLF
ncbi:MAG: Trk system potassium transporter TrkA [Alphaproteobacteria bacterium]|nr:Trk system potassium transporter TrkA [Alphaproteobacteria bacterium]